MKKYLIGIVALGLALGIGTSVLANTIEDDIPSFKEMFPLMKQMHPDWTDEELETMYRFCHGEGSNDRGMMRQIVD